MENARCFERMCMEEIEYACKCTSPFTYSCAKHWNKHSRLPNRAHAFEPIFLEPNAETKEAVLKFLGKKKSKIENLISNAMASLSKHIRNSENETLSHVNKLKENLEELSDFSEKIDKAGRKIKEDADRILTLLALSPEEAIKDTKEMIPIKSDSYKSLKYFCGFSEEMEKMAEYFIEEKIKACLEKRLVNIEKTLERHENFIRPNKDVFDEIEMVKDSILNLKTMIEKNERELEEWRLLELNRYNEINLINSQIQNTFSLNTEINEKVDQLIIEIQTDLLLQILKEKTSSLLHGENNIESMQDFRKYCPFNKNELIEIRKSKPILAHAFQEYFNAYHQKSSLYLVDSSILFTLDTENGLKERKTLNTRENIALGTCITQLQSGDLFCFGNYPPSGITLIIDRDYKTQILPSGPPCSFSSAIYFNGSIYCFGGLSKMYLNLSERFDLKTKEWISLKEMRPADYKCHCVVIKRNILVSGFLSKNLLSYSIDKNSFTQIQYQFASETRKILINAEGRLYVVECGGRIYESEIKNEKVWNPIAYSAIENLDYWQVYCSYNKGEINIATLPAEKYYKFNLQSKIIEEQLGFW